MRRHNRVAALEPPRTARLLQVQPQVFATESSVDVDWAIRTAVPNPTEQPFPIMFLMKAKSENAKELKKEKARLKRELTEAKKVSKQNPPGLDPKLHISEFPWPFCVKCYYVGTIEVGEARLRSQNIKTIQKGVREMESFRDNGRPVTLCLHMEGIKVHDALGNILMAHNIHKIPMIHREREFSMMAFVAENPSDAMKLCHVFDFRVAKRNDLVHGLVLRIMDEIKRLGDIAGTRGQPNSPTHFFPSS